MNRIPAGHLQRTNSHEQFLKFKQTTAIWSWLKEWNEKKWLTGKKETHMTMLVLELRKLEPCQWRNDDNDDEDDEDEGCLRGLGNPNCGVKRTQKLGIGSFNFFDGFSVSPSCFFFCSALSLSSQIVSHVEFFQNFPELCSLTCNCNWSGAVELWIYVDLWMKLFI